MNEMALLRAALWVVGGSGALAIAAIFLHGAWLEWRERGSAQRLERARGVLAAGGVRATLAPSEQALLRRLTRREQVRLFSELAPSLQGSALQRLARVAEELGLLWRAEALCASDRWWLRLSGVRLLAALGRGAGVVPRLLTDPHPLVRGEAAGWAGQHPDPELVERLVQLLDHPDPRGSWAVRDSLLRIGGGAVPALVRYLEVHQGLRTLAALELAAGLGDARFAPAALRLASDPEPAVRAHAATLAGAIGGAELVQVLEQRLADPAPAVRAAAAAALGGLGHWPAAARLARLLGDPAWVVRSQSALALRRMGSPGLLLLRRGLDDADPFAADIARQVLDLPGTSVEGAPLP